MTTPLWSAGLIQISFGADDANKILQLTLTIMPMVIHDNMTTQCRINTWYLLVLMLWAHNLTGRSNHSVHSYICMTTPLCSVGLIQISFGADAVNTLFYRLPSTCPQIYMTTPLCSARLIWDLCWGWDFEHTGLQVTQNTVFSVLYINGTAAWDSQQSLMVPALQTQFTGPLQCNAHNCMYMYVNITTPCTNHDSGTADAQFSDFLLACKDFGRRLNQWIPTCTFFFLKWRSAHTH